MTNPTQPAEGMPELLPCPWCGAGETQIVENGRVWGGHAYGEPISISVRHWCTVAGQPNRMLERIGRDRESAIAAWNTRAAPTAPPMPDEVRICVDTLCFHKAARYITWPDQLTPLLDWLAAHGFTKE